MAQIDQLRHFLAVIEHGGFRRAAEAIHLTQPALTKSIKRLEAGFGVELINRKSRRARPTPFGEVVAAGARRILTELKQTHREIDLLKGFESGKLVVGCDPYAATGILAPALARLVSMHPMLRYEIEVGNWTSLREKLMARQIDVHVGASPEIYGPEFETEIFVMEPVIYFCRPDHPLIRRDNIDVKDLLAYPRIGIETPPEWRRMYAGITRSMEPNADTVHPRFATADSWDVVKAIVRDSDTISGGPRSVIEAELRAGFLVELQPLIPLHQPKGAIAYLKHRVLPPAADTLIREIKRTTGLEISADS